MAGNRQEIKRSRWGMSLVSLAATMLLLASVVQGTYATEKRIFASSLRSNSQEECIVLSNGVPASGSLPFGYYELYCFQVPSGATYLTISTSASCDVDLYVKYGAPPTYLDNDCAQISPTGNETCATANPPAGVYYIAVDYEYFDPTTCNYTVTASYTGGGTCTLDCSAAANPGSGNAPLTVNFQGSATPSNCTGNVTYSWDFGDGQTSTQQNPTHTYTNQGNYTVNMTATIAGVTCSRSGTITVNQGPTCTLACTAQAAPTSGNAPLAVNFTSTATPSNCTGQPSYSWNFGDGQTSTQQNPSHTYNSAGTYNWTLTVSIGQTTCTKNGTVSVSGGGTGIDMTVGTASGSAGSNVTVTITTANNGTSPAGYDGKVQYDTSQMTFVSIAAGSVTTANGNAVSANEFPAGTVKFLIEPSTNLTTINGGEVAVLTFTIKGGATCPGTTTLTLLPEVNAFDAAVKAIPVIEHNGSVSCGGGGNCTLTCTANANPTSGAPPLNVNFSATATPSNCTGQPSYSWNFGDGQTSTQQNPSHTYNSAGTYNWTLTVSIGQTTCTKNGAVSVSGGGTGIDMTVGTASGSAGSNVTVTITTANNGTSPAGYDGKVQYDTTQLTFVSIAAGSVTGANGNAVSANETPAGTVKFLIEPSTNLTTINGGDVAVMTFQIKANATCPGTTTLTLVPEVNAFDAAVKAIPVIEHNGSLSCGGGGNCTLTCTANANPSSGAPPLNVNFSATATPSNCTGQPSYSWNFGDGQTSTQQNPSHTYNSAGNYSWTLTVSVGQTTCSKGGSIAVAGGGDGIDMTVATVSGSAGQNAVVQITTSNNGKSPVGYDGKITFDTNQFAVVSIAAGSVTTANGNAVSANETPPGTLKFLIEPNTNLTTIAGGEVAKVTFTLKAGVTCPGSFPLNLQSDVNAFDASVKAIPVIEHSGAVTCGGGGGKPGDCDNNGTVTIGEVQKAINMFLGTLAPGCGVDCNGNGQVSIGEVQKVINVFLGLATSC